MDEQAKAFEQWWESTGIDRHSGIYSCRKEDQARKADARRGWYARQQEVDSLRSQLAEKERRNGVLDTHYRALESQNFDLTHERDSLRAELDEAKKKAQRERDGIIAAFTSDETVDLIAKAAEGQR